MAGSEFIYIHIVVGDVLCFMQFQWVSCSQHVLFTRKGSDLCWRTVCVPSVGSLMEGDFLVSNRLPNFSVKVKVIMRACSSFSGFHGLVHLGENVSQGHCFSQKLS